MEGLDREREAAGVTADLVQRDEAVPAVEGGVLDALGVDGRCRLLEAHDERVVPALFEQKDLREPIGQVRLVDGGAVVVRHKARLRVDIGAIDVEGRERGVDVGVEGKLGGELRHLVLEARPRLFELRLGREL